MRVLSVLLFLVVATFMCATMATATPFHFPVVAGNKKCFTEELSINRYTFTYSMRRALSQFVSITVTGENGVKLWEQKQISEEGRTILLPATAGPYTICYHVNKKAKAITVPTLIEMDVELESVQQEREQKRYGETNHEDPAIPQAEYLDRTIRAVKDSYDYFRMREASLRNTNESSNSRMLIFTVLSIILVVVVTVFKEYKLQTFLKKKKFLD